jgi:hypothetical protein
VSRHAKSPPTRQATSLYRGPARLAGALPASARARSQRAAEAPQADREEAEGTPGEQGTRSQGQDRALTFCLHRQGSAAAKDPPTPIRATRAFGGFCGRLCCRGRSGLCRVPLVASLDGPAHYLSDRVRLMLLTGHAHIWFAFRHTEIRDDRLRRRTGRSG